MAHGQQRTFCTSKPHKAVPPSWSITRVSVAIKLSAIRPTLEALSTDSSRQQLFDVCCEACSQTLKTTQPQNQPHTAADLCSMGQQSLLRWLGFTAQSLVRRTPQCIGSVVGGVLVNAQHTPTHVSLVKSCNCQPITLQIKIALATRQCKLLPVQDAAQGCARRLLTNSQQLDLHMPAVQQVPGRQQITRALPHRSLQGMLVGKVHSHKHRHTPCHKAMSCRKSVLQPHTGCRQCPVCCNYVQHDCVQPWDPLPASSAGRSHSSSCSLSASQLSYRLS